MKYKNMYSVKIEKKNENQRFALKIQSKCKFVCKKITAVPKDYWDKKKFVQHGTFISQFYTH